ncbi:hypothetical protein DB346_24810 [Verrucomicrobia bacterium LW23]|nr:hypothetical protein DB346_24810 [Verrucomicrobia bacterium LW23]
MGWHTMTRVAVCLGLPIFFMAAIFAGPWIYAVCTQNAGWFNRAEMESLVAQVRQHQFVGDKYFAWTMVSGKATLLPGTEEGNALLARRSQEGKLTIAIITRDYHHAGVFGFAWSEAGFSPTMDVAYSDPNRLILDVPSSICYTRKGLQIDAHWWEVFNDLN